MISTVFSKVSPSMRFASMSPTIVRSTESPAATPGIVQVTKAPGAPSGRSLQVNSPPAKLTPAGSWSWTVMLVALDGPLFDTVIVHVTCSPATAGSGLALFETAKSLI